MKSKDLRRQPRWLQKWYAKLFGYFWLPCPLCGEYFGGHEWGDGDYIWSSIGRGEGVCANCGARARKLNWEQMPELIDP